MISRLSIIFLAVALLTLAGFQYHWIGQISAAERQRLEAGVRDSSFRFSGDFAGELRSLTNVLDFRGVEPGASAIARRYHGWAETASYPELLHALYLVKPGPSGGLRISRVDLQGESLQSVDWPPQLSPLQTFLRRDTFGRDLFNGAQRALPRLDVPALLIPIGLGRPPGPQPGPQRGRGGPGPGPGFGAGPPRLQDRTDRNDRNDRNDAWLVLELSNAAITGQIFPALVARDFTAVGDREYRIAVVSTPAPLTVFSTGKEWTPEDLASPDFSVDLTGNSGQPGPPGQLGQNGGGRGGPPRGGRGGGPLPGIYVGRDLKLLVKHESGSLEKAVSNLRRRNLAISFGILLILGLGAGAGIVSGQRARTLGRLQMEFAAGVSHELRTPLAVIQSAAHNLRAGVVRDREAIEEYAAIVQSEARRLSSMVEQVMTYAETQSGRKRYDIAPVDLNTVVDNALRNMAIPLAEAGASVENRIDAQLPSALADEAASTQCVQNLLSNALKYGRGTDSVQIEIESEVDRNTGTIQIRMIDHGPGVPVVDERHLFDPFHRGSNAATNTPGNGLGLHLVRRIMEAQKGTVTYRRAADGGACFTLTLPAENGKV